MEYDTFCPNCATLMSSDQWLCPTCGYDTDTQYCWDCQEDIEDCICGEDEW